MAANGIHCPDDSQPSGPPKAAARNPQPLVVAMGASTGGSRMPATSFPSLSTRDTNDGYTGPEKAGGLFVRIPSSNESPQLNR